MRTIWSCFPAFPLVFCGQCGLRARHKKALSLLLLYKFFQLLFARTEAALSASLRGDFIYGISAKLPDKRAYYTVLDAED